LLSLKINQSDNSLDEVEITSKEYFSHENILIASFLEAGITTSKKG